MQTVPAIYDDIGVRPIINGRGATTAVGGTLMSPEVLAMTDAANAFVVLDELNRRVGERVATLTGMESGYVTSGSAAGMVLAAAGVHCRNRSRTNQGASGERRLANELVIHRAHRINYDQMLRIGGGRLGGDRRRGSHRNRAGAGGGDYGLNGRSLRVDSRHTSPGALDFATVVRVAHDRGVPVIVDAASTVPPVDHLRRWGHWGADLGFFSGGKGLRGPQDSGFRRTRRPHRGGAGQWQSPRERRAGHESQQRGHGRSVEGNRALPGDGS